LAQVRQKRGETVVEYIQHFKEVKNRWYSTRISEKEEVELASLGLQKPIKDLAFQLEFNSLAHLVQNLTTYDQRHPELYQDRFKRQVTLILGMTKK
jgi:UDP-glucose 4-epimerase